MSRQGLFPRFVEPDDQGETRLVSVAQVLMSRTLVGADPIFK